MAEKRMLSKVISISEKVNTLPDIFDMLLFTWMIPHTDDFGRLGGSPAKVKALVVPMLDKTIREVDTALNNLAEAELILWYEANGEKVIQISNFEKHQQGLKGKKSSKFASPNSHLTLNNGYLSASESDIEEMIAESLVNNSFIDGDDVISVERQLRIDNSYLDILATGIHGRYLFEIKRQRLSNASIEQILKYRDMLKDSDVHCILIGNGLASNFDLQKCTDEKVNVLIYDDSLALESKLLFNVKCRYSKLLSNRTEENRTEENRTEENRTELEQISGGRSRQDNPFRMFENEGFGMLSPILAERLGDMSDDYGDRWVCEAMKRAVVKGKRNLGYVEGILKNWRADGIDEPWKEEQQHAESNQGSGSRRTKTTSGSSESEFAFLDKPGRS